MSKLSSRDCIAIYIENIFTCQLLSHDQKLYLQRKVRLMLKSHTHEVHKNIFMKLSLINEY